MEFSIESYRKVIKAAVDLGYTFGQFQGGVSRPIGKVYLRHDVDYSLGMAAEIARANADLGVSGTFFVLLRSDIYNALSPSSIASINEITQLGQHLGLHTPAPRDGMSRDVEDSLGREFEWLKSEFPAAVPVFAWHNPTPAALSASTTPRVCGLVNVYHDQWTSDIGYLSDSNLRNSPEAFVSWLESHEGKSVQLLLHPLNWVAGGCTMRDVFAGTWKRVIREREVEFALNRWYASAWPRGMDDQILDEFARRWSEGAGGNTQTSPSSK